MQVLLTVAYDGTAYAGWQRQINGITVQQRIEDILTQLLARPVILRAASRTDAGVHALGQRAAFAADGLKIPLYKLPWVLNGYLPTDISIKAADYVPDDFNPRHAMRKTYHYQIYNGSTPDPMLRRYSAFLPQTLNIEAMKRCAALFIGRHDFAAFHKTVPGPGYKSTEREIYDCHIKQNAPLIVLSVTGNGFLYNMVRILAGTVAQAGFGKIKPENIPAIIKSKDRARAGQTMPPEGLTLIEVMY